MNINKIPPALSALWWAFHDVFVSDFEFVIGVRIQKEKGLAVVYAAGPRRYWVVCFFLFSICDLLNWWKLFKQMLGKDNQILDVDNTITPGHWADVTE